MLPPGLGNHSDEQPLEGVRWQGVLVGSWLPALFQGAPVCGGHEGEAWELADRGELEGGEREFRSLQLHEVGSDFINLATRGLSIYSHPAGFKIVLES